MTNCSWIGRSWPNGRGNLAVCAAGRVAGGACGDPGQDRANRPLPGNRRIAGPDGGPRPARPARRWPAGGVRTARLPVRPRVRPPRARRRIWRGGDAAPHRPSGAAPGPARRQRPDRAERHPGPAGRAAGLGGVKGMVTPAESLLHTHVASAVVGEGASTMHEGAALHTPLVLVPGPIPEVMLLTQALDWEGAAQVLHAAAGRAGRAGGGVQDRLGRHAPAGGDAGTRIRPGDQWGQCGGGACSAERGRTASALIQRRCRRAGWAVAVDKPFGRLRDAAGAFWDMGLRETGISAATAQT